MAAITVITRDGRRRAVSAESGLRCMRSLRDGVLDVVAAMCGGCCSCVTCHVYGDHGEHGGLPPLHSDENEVLETFSHLLQNFRLLCQVPFTAELNGLTVTVAPEG